MRITVEQLRRIIRETIEEETGRQHVQEGFMDGVRNLFGVGGGPEDMDEYLKKLWPLNKKLYSHEIDKVDVTKVWWGSADSEWLKSLQNDLKAVAGLNHPDDNIININRQFAEKLQGILTEKTRKYFETQGKDVFKNKKTNGLGPFEHMRRFLTGGDDDKKVKIKIGRNELVDLVRPTKPKDRPREFTGSRDLRDYYGYKGR
jgi:hypothetical protein